MAVVFPRTGGGPLISRAGPVLARSIQLHWELYHPIAGHVGLIQKPMSQMTIGAGHMTRRLFIGCRYVDARLALAQSVHR